MARTPTLLLLAALLGAACAPAVETDPRPRTSRDLITAEAIRTTQMSTLWDAVQRLQPTWVAQPAGGGTIAVFVDERAVGDASFLRQIPASQVSEVRYVNPRQVGAELTSRQAAGVYAAIMVTTIRM